MLDNVIQPRANKAADNRGHRDRAGEVRVNFKAWELTTHDQGRNKKAEHGHHTKAMQGERADFEQVRIHVSLRLVIHLIWALPKAGRRRARANSWRRLDCSC